MGCPVSILDIFVSPAAPKRTKGCRDSVGRVKSAAGIPFSSEELRIGNCARSVASLAFIGECDESAGATSAQAVIAHINPNAKMRSTVPSDADRKPIDSGRRQTRLPLPGPLICSSYVEMTALVPRYVSRVISLWGWSENPSKPNIARACPARLERTCYQMLVSRPRLPLTSLFDTTPD